MTELKLIISLVLSFLSILNKLQYLMKNMSQDWRRKLLKPRESDKKKRQKESGWKRKTQESRQLKLNTNHMFRMSKQNVKAMEIAQMNFIVYHMSFGSKVLTAANKILMIKEQNVQVSQNPIVMQSMKRILATGKRLKNIQI